MKIMAANIEISTKTLARHIAEGFYKDPIIIIPHGDWRSVKILSRLRYAADKIITTDDGAFLVWASDSQYKLAGKLPNINEATTIILDKNLDTDLLKRLEEVKMKDIPTFILEKLYAEIETTETRGGLGGLYSVMEHYTIIHPEKTLWMWEDLYETNAYYALVSRGNKPAQVVKMKMSDSRPPEGTYTERRVDGSGGI